PPLVKCDGVLTTITRQEILDWLKPYDCPMVRMLIAPTPELEEASSHIPLISADYESAGRLGAKHLLTLGQPHFAFYQRGVGPDVLAIRRGFVDTLHAAGHSVTVLDFLGDHPNLDALTRVPRAERREWLARRIRALPKPLAIMAEDDRFAIEVMHAVRGMGLRIPTDVAILGSDDNRLALGASPVSISSVDTNLRGVGYAAAGVLAGLIQGKEKPAQTIHIPSRRVLARESTATYAGSHEGVSEALRFVRQHFREPLQASRVARHARMSLRGLQSALRQEAHLTLNDEIARLRVVAAGEMLEETDLKLDSIAADVGLRDAKNLCRVFRQRYGMTPQQWRSRLEHEG
ncbi:MAG TPA: substrate-binding domain-containing protein, partial [Verrucomicrobium sp.]|nr:substrate-binding domain-containing protein [Verrucomicrobium sp.]